VELEGVWWIPADPAEQIYGVLESADYAGWPRLSLRGSFEKKLSFGGGDLYQAPVLHGASLTGTPLTLLNCVEVGHTLNLRFGLDEKHQRLQTLECDYAISGAHLPPITEIRIAEAAIALTGLREWMWTFGWKRTYGKGTAESPFELSYTRPPPIAAACSSADIALLMGLQNTRHASPFDIASEEIAWIRVRPTLPLAIGDFIPDLQEPLQDFLCFGVRRPCKVQRVTITTNAEPERLELWYRSRAANAELPEKAAHPATMLFTLGDISDNLAEVLDAWLNSASELQPVRDLLFGSLYSGGFIETEFLMLAQAAEAYHRLRFSNSCWVRTPELVERLIAQLQDDIRGTQGLGHDARQSMLKKMEFLNEISLKRRFLELLNHTHDTRTLIIPDERQFAKLAADTRNYFSHYTDDLRTRAARGRRLYLLTYQLRCLVEMCLMVDIRMSAETQERTISKSQPFQHTRALLRRVEREDTDSDA
jgi:hypothetical protein